MSRAVGLLIDGSWHTGDVTFDVVGPVHTRIVSVAQAIDVGSVDRVIDAAHSAQDDWAHAAVSVRRRILLDAADILDGRRELITEIMLDECGGTAGWAAFNVALGANVLREAAYLAMDAGSGWQIPSGVTGLEARAIRRPVGPSLGIAPWNAPVILGVRAVAAPLACGNTVILKGSEQSPAVHAEIVRALHDAGCPAGVVQYITCDGSDAPKVVAKIINDPRIRHVNFTGSTHVGRAIALEAARSLTRSVLELGGKSAAIVLADADVDLAADAITFGGFMNAGQICMSTERVIAESAVVSELVEALRRRADGLRVGDPADPETEVGPLVSVESRTRAMALIQDAVSLGAVVETGGVLDGEYLRPTVLSRITDKMRLYTEESFAPIVCVLEVESPEEAVREANTSEYGLSSAVFSRDVSAARAVAARLETGICHINGATVHDEPQMPFGGVKSSGWGRFGGHAAIHEFTDLHWETVQHGGRHYPI